MKGGQKQDLILVGSLKKDKGNITKYNNELVHLQVQHNEFNKLHKPSACDVEDIVNKLSGVKDEIKSSIQIISPSDLAYTPPLIRSL